ncbi:MULTISPECIES: class I SAM-dependent methyltransferase [Bacillaceae]|uniref:SAM-dependent methyltransferase n=1 Tax=Evansella alkalicola TaxID=745819 RepID=A0ABS6K024_9BACI|nr:MULTISPECIES: SAM-dependent methyltransferase [Bacillaceae]MBU9724202.1 SAM-dependent methyltransferase [Bacillus alkalicola]
MGDILQKLSQRSTPPWSYSTFMDTALYDKEIGYYMKTNRKLGKEGDFYTSNHVHPVFPKTCARFFADVIQKEGLDPSICEWGAGDGRFAKSALTYFKEKEEALFENMHYLIIEASPYHQETLKIALGEFEDKVKVYSTYKEMVSDHPSFSGVIFSNELLDAFPVKVVEKEKDQLFEVKLEEVEGELKEVLYQADEELEKWLEQYGPSLPNHYRTEINFSMKEWLEEVAPWLERGIIVTIDYGYTNEELLAPERREGSLRGYYKHEMIHNPLKHPGNMDLTSHVQWDAYKKIISSYMTEVVHTSQDKFLLKAGLFTFLEEVKDFNPFSDTYKLNRAIQSLVQPGGISSAFQVNVNGKGLSCMEEYAFFNEDPYEWKG